MHAGRYPPNPFANAPLDRCGELRKDGARLSTLATSPTSRYLLIAGERTVVDLDSLQPLILSYAEAQPHVSADSPAIFLGEYEGQPLFVADLGEIADEKLARELAARAEGLRSLGLKLPPDQASLAAYARAMILWDRRHRFCGRCGGMTASLEGGHVRRCSDPDCGNNMFPRVDPAIIVLVADGQRALLGRQANWDPGRYSTLAGFVEPGESLEEAVAREVFEEAGIKVSLVDYHSSQPWPFPSSLMLGFTAEAATTDISLRDGELEDAGWYSREDIAARRISLPFPVSISYRLIENWYDGQTPGRMAHDLAATEEAP